MTIPLIERPAAREDGYQARRFRGRADWWFGEDSQGHPVLLVTDAKSDLSPDIETADLLVLRARRCVISGPDPAEGLFTILACRSELPHVRRYFADLCADFERWSRDDPTRTVSDLIAHLVHLFRQLRAPAQKTEQGIWGELLVIASAERPDLLINAWHRHVVDRYDFSAGRQRLEIKTCMSDRRVHHFALDQLTDTLLDICVVSLVVEPSAGGATVVDLVDEILSRKELTADHVLSLRRVVAETLGDDWLRAAREGFDRRRAVLTGRFIRASDIPSVPRDLPRTVSQVSFMSDVSGALYLTRSEVTTAGGIWAVAAAMLPMS